MKPSKNGFLNSIIIALIATVVIVYFYPHPEANRFNYEEGRPWNYAKLIAPFDIPIHPDSMTVQRARDTLDAHFVPIYELNQLMIDTIVHDLPESVGNNHRALLSSELRKIYASGVVDSKTKDEIGQGKLPKIRVLEKNILSEMATHGFTSPREIYLKLDSLFDSTEVRQYITQANLHTILRPNYIKNEEECKRHYEYDYITLTADRGIILQGQTIIDKGAVISPQDYTNLRTYETMLAERNMNDSENDILMLLGQLGYVALLLCALMGYFYFFAPDIFKRPQALVFVLALLVLFFLVCIGLDHFIAQGIYISPMMIVPILLLVFFDGRTALFVTFVLTLICAGVTSFALEFIFLQFIATATVVFSLRELSRRSQLLRTSLIVAVSYILSYLVLELLMNGSLNGATWRMPSFLLVNAGLTSMAYILMFAVEKIFGFTSVVTLVELADINTPLLLRLSNECPGTFQHAIAVSNLAADAAQRIGANVQLVRAGALYHDVGKLLNPAFFTENQHGVNPHDVLPPERSAAIVINHVTDGLKLADKAGLPVVIRSFISEHHGAGKAKYFYYTYIKAHGEENVDPTIFTYPGPNPQSRETSVMMMADAVEAASRSIKEPTHEAITDLVNKIIDSQISEGLHNESTLAFKDVNIIKESFIKRLATIYHSRIAYPSAAIAIPRQESGANDSKQ